MSVLWSWSVLEQLTESFPAGRAQSPWSGGAKKELPYRGHYISHCTMVKVFCWVKGHDINWDGLITETWTLSHFHKSLSNMMFQQDVEQEVTVLWSIGRTPAPDTVLAVLSFSQLFQYQKRGKKASPTGQLWFGSFLHAGPLCQAAESDFCISVLLKGENILCISVGWIWTRMMDVEWSGC